MPFFNIPEQIHELFDHMRKAEQIRGIRADLIPDNESIQEQQLKPELMEAIRKQMMPSEESKQ